MRNRGSIFFALAASCALLLSSQASPAFVTVGVSITIAPPELPVYEQPPIPGPGYLWTPGYWAWADGDYYWVPGTWVEAPEPGFLWTPGYWGWVDGLYIWHEGYWGPHVGFYGGVNYGFGYLGHGYEGGYWDHGAFRYNRAYNNIREDVHITNVYNRTVIVNNGREGRVSFNGGNGGIQARPAPQELTAERERHVTPVSAQLHHEDVARGNPELRSSANRGQPPIGATPHPGVFSGQGIVPARTMSVPHPAGGGSSPNAPATSFGTPSHGTPPTSRGSFPGTSVPAPSHGPGPTGGIQTAPPHGTVPGAAAPPHGNFPGTSVPAPPHGAAGGPGGAPGGAGAAHAPPSATYQHGGTPGGPAAGSGHPAGGGSPPPAHEREPHGEHDRPQ